MHQKSSTFYQNQCIHQLSATSPQIESIHQLPANQPQSIGIRSYSLAISHIPPNSVIHPPTINHITPDPVYLVPPTVSHDPYIHQVTLSLGWTLTDTLPRLLAWETFSWQGSAGDCTVWYLNAEIPKFSQPRKSWSHCLLEEEIKETRCNWDTIPLPMNLRIMMTMRRSNCKR